jgi:two-component system cell cycle response regulator
MDERTEMMEHTQILIVDDDPHTLEILSRWLARESYQTVRADSGITCLERLAENRIDVIVLDVMMPDMDGLQVCERLRAHPDWRSIPVILLTAKDDIETRARGMTLGVSEYLTKPVNKLELLTRLKAQVRSRALARRLGETAAAIGESAKP